MADSIDDRAATEVGARRAGVGEHVGAGDHPAHDIVRQRSVAGRGREASEELADLASRPDCGAVGHLGADDLQTDG